MSLHPIVRPKAREGVPSRGEASTDGEKSIKLDPQKDVPQLAKKLASVGGGVLSTDLALDLVLNEVVEQARTATRASGAAIALTRDEEIVCRATTGNAPELGVRVDSRSGLSGACLSWGQTQSCSDTDTDPRVNAEACRRLHVRSMVMVPVVDDKGCFGILQVFAPEPRAFGESDITALETLAQKVAEAKTASEQTLAAEPIPAVVEETVAEDAIPSAPEEQRSTAATPDVLKESLIDSGIQTSEPRSNDILTSILVVLVITAAILLGLVVGVRLERKGAKGGPRGETAKSTSASGRASTQQMPTGTPSAVNTQSAASSEAKRPAAPVGGLIVTDRGKVIYRSGPTNPVNAAKNALPRGLIHRVEPKYPESAKVQHIEGPVVLDAQVLGDGTVGNIAIVQGHPLLAEAATEAVKQWKFEPSMVDGKPVDRQERITVRFTLPSS